MKKNNMQKLILASNFAAMAVVLGVIQRYTPGLNALKMPQGGHILGLPMIPILTLGLLVGPWYAMLGGLVYGLIDIFVDGGVFHWGSIFFDYLLPGIALALTGFFKKGLNKPWILILAFLTAGLFKWILHGLGGVIFFSEYSTHTNVWFYSFILYNGPYMLSGITVSIIVGLLLRKRLSQLATKIRE